MKKKSSKPSCDDLQALLRKFDSDQELRVSHAYEDGGLTMLFGRLERAVVNQVENGEATVPRYAIWANTVRDHISAAMRLLDGGGNKDEAIRLLTHAHNSLSAFSEVQKKFDPIFGNIPAS